MWGETVEQYLGTARRPINIPPVAFVDGKCLAMDSIRSKCPYYGFNGHQNILQNGRFNWSKFETAKPKCEERMR